MGKTRTPRKRCAACLPLHANANPIPIATHGNEQAKLASLRLPVHLTSPHHRTPLDGILVNNTQLRLRFTDRISYVYPHTRA